MLTDHEFNEIMYLDDALDKWKADETRDFSSITGVRMTSDGKKEVARKAVDSICAVKLTDFIDYIQITVNSKLVT